MRAPRRAHSRATLGLAALLAAALLVAGCGGGDSGGGAPVAVAPPPPITPAPGIDQPLVDTAVYSAQPNVSLASAVEAAAITHHQILVKGSTLRYTATAGHLTARALTTGQAQASFFYVAYTLDAQDPGTRPVTFFYNGGPGSATVWLHLGSFGPKRLAAGAPSTSVPTPFPLVDNEETLLGTTDLVFVDAIGAGLSEAIAPNTNQTFWGVDADAATFRDFVRRYVEVNRRSASPKYLFGESYGAARSAVLAHLLESAGVSLRGVVLQSSALDYSSNCGVTISPARTCAHYLPTYASVGAWYSLLQPNPVDFPGFVGMMRSYALATYAPAVASYVVSGVQPGIELLTDLVNKTGAPLAVWQSRFNLDPTTFQFRLLPNVLIGRYDARVSAPTGSALAFAGDPSSSFISPSFGRAIASYLSDTLRYSTTSAYVMLGNAIDTWNFEHDGKHYPDTIPDLAAAMTLNPGLRVLSLNGYHDLATPFFVTELDLARLGAPGRVQIRSYGGGHMTYLDDAARAQELADLEAFYRAAPAAQ